MYVVLLMYDHNKQMPDLIKSKKKLRRNEKNFNEAP